MDGADPEQDPGLTDGEVPLELLSDKKVTSPKEMREELRRIIGKGALKENIDDTVGDHDPDIMHP